MASEASRDHVARLLNGHVIFQQGLAQRSLASFKGLTQVEQLRMVQHRELVTCPLNWPS
jgi:hypothetical protein